MSHSQFNEQGGQELLGVVLPSGQLGHLGQVFLGLFQSLPLAAQETPDASLQPLHLHLTLVPPEVLPEARETADELNIKSKDESAI